MSQKSDIRAEAERLRGLFEAEGAEVFEAEILQPAGALLNVYGEDIRARAFVTLDPLRGEMMLRPDFTVPLVQRHIEAGRAAAKYTYAGEIFRRQEDDETRPTEYMQVGYEVFGGSEPEADAEVFAQVANALDGLPVTAATGDLGILTAAVEALETPERRKKALLRHLWRPARFKALLDRFSQPAPPPPPVPAADIPHVGLRSHGEIQSRIQLLEDEHNTAPIAAGEVERLAAILAVNDRAPKAVETLRSIANGGSALGGAVERLAARLDALSDAGVEPSQLQFEASYGRTSMEYYSGFVFGFSADHAPAVATGGRYDLLTEALGSGTQLPAVGAVIRPDAVLAVRGALA
ncbi:MAG: ATP phosphoribosyltransferase regulatory subunit [Boseongicola sp.]|nr:ATP phosphoribosyltransferase regulatory subunit [Boseongicola sp.]MDD9978601.1 ATP phosphoribosyltransferase regulatory subunit [Boseongicola sp.]